MIIYLYIQKVQSRSLYVLPKLSSLLAPLTNLYCNVFAMPMLGKVGHFEFLFESLSSFELEDAYSMQISQRLVSEARLTL